MFLALVIMHAMRMPYFVFFGLSESTMFSPHYLINGAIFAKIKRTEHKMYKSDVWLTVHRNSVWIRKTN